MLDLEIQGLVFAVEGFSLTLFRYFPPIPQCEMGIYMLSHCMLEIWNLLFFFSPFLFILADSQELVLSLRRDYELWTF